MTTESSTNNTAFVKEVAKIEASLLKAVTTKSVVYLRILNAMGDLTVADAYLLLTDDLKSAINAASFSVTISRTKTLREACVKAGVDTKGTLEANNGLDGARRAMGLDQPKGESVPKTDMERATALIAKLTVAERAAILLSLESDTAVMAAAGSKGKGVKVAA